MSYYSDRNSNPHKSHLRQNVNTRQKLIQDQNYSTQMFLGMMSTLQSLIRYYQQTHQSQFNNKMFKAYDRVDYSSKSLLELKSQLKSQILLNQASRLIFRQEHPHQNWRLPSNFKENEVIGFLNSSLFFFKDVNDQESYRMTEDVGSILNEKLTNLYSENLRFELNYSPEQKKQHQKNTVTNGIFAGQQMDELEEEAKKYQDVSDITAKINFQNSPFSSINKPKEVFLALKDGQIPHCSHYLNHLHKNGLSLIPNKFQNEGFMRPLEKETIYKELQSLKNQGFLIFVCIRLDQNDVVQYFEQCNLV